MGLIEGTAGQPGQPGQEGVAGGVLAGILSRFTPLPPVESKGVSMPASPFAPCVAPSQDDPWDAAGATGVISQVDALIDAALAPGGQAATLARRRILANERIIVRRLERDHDPFLWNWPEALDRLLARWSAWAAGHIG
jgi:hypothetical protein